jgi:drug/metabolite transporter (DMT)-like permease
LKEKIQGRFWLFAVPAIFGAYLVSFGLVWPAALWQTAGNLSWHGPALAILAALLWAGGTVVGRGLLFDLNFQFVTSLRFIFGFIFLLIYVKVFEVYQLGIMTPLFWQNTLIIALMTGFFALLLYYYGLKGTKASVATLMELGYPLALTVVNWKFLDIVLNSWQIFGALLLLASVTILSLKSNSDSSRVGGVNN